MAPGGWRAFAHHYGLHGLVAAPGSWPAARAAIWLSNWIWVIPLSMLALVFLLFPTGRLRTRRWRPAAWFDGGALTLATAGALMTASRIWARPFATRAPARRAVVGGGDQILTLAVDLPGCSGNGRSAFTSLIACA